MRHQEEDEDEDEEEEEEIAPVIEIQGHKTLDE